MRRALVGLIVVGAMLASPFPATGLPRGGTILQQRHPACAGVEATLVGTPGDDLLTGTDGRDSIVGLGGNDVLVGLEGNDLLCGGLGDDRLFGGPGADSLQAKRHDLVDGGSGEGDAVSFRGLCGYLTVQLKRGHYDSCNASGRIVHIEVVFGSVWQDQLIGSRRAETFWGGGSGDLIRGLGGDDALHGEEGKNHIFGGAGDDRMDARGSRRAVLIGGDGSDRLIGTPGRDRLIGGPGNDIANGFGQNDALDGGSGMDELNGGGHGHMSWRRDGHRLRSASEHWRSVTSQDDGLLPKRENAELAGTGGKVCSDRRDGGGLAVGEACPQVVSRP